MFGRLEPTTGIEPFGRLVAQVMTIEPYASADRVFWVVDNGSSHRGTTSVERMTKAWPTAQLVHLPVHASWLDQAEIFFSILQRKVVTPNDFTDLDAIAERVLAFQARYNATATPFDWRFTRTDLDRLLDRIAVHDATAPSRARPGRLMTPTRTSGAVSGLDRGDADELCERIGRLTDLADDV